MQFCKTFWLPAVSAVAAALCVWALTPAAARAAPCATPTPGQPIDMDAVRDETTRLLDAQDDAALINYFSCTDTAELQNSDLHAKDLTTLLQKRGTLLFNRQKYALAAAAFARSLPDALKLYGAQSADYARLLSDLGKAQFMSGQVVEGLARLNAAITIAEKRDGKQSIAAAERWRDLAFFTLQLRPQTALQAALKARAIAEKTLFPADPSYQSIALLHAIALQNSGNIAGADAAFRALMENLQSENSFDKGILADALSQYGYLLNLQGKYAQAQAMQAKAIEAYAENGGPLAQVNQARARYFLALTLRDKGATAQGLAGLREASAEFDRLLGPEDPNALCARSALAHSLSASGDKALALSVCADALERVRRSPLQRGTNAEIALAGMRATLLLEAGQTEAAAKLANEGRASAALVKTGVDPQALAMLDHVTAGALAANGKYAEALKLQRAVTARALKMPGNFEDALAGNFVNIAQLARQLGDFPQALGALRQARLFALRYAGHAGPGQARLQNAAGGQAAFNITVTTAWVAAHAVHPTK